MFLNLCNNYDKISGFLAVKHFVESHIYHYYYVVSLILTGSRILKALYQFMFGKYLEWSAWWVR